MVALFPGLLHLQFSIACSMQKLRKTGGVEGLGTRLEKWNHSPNGIQPIASPRGMHGTKPTSLGTSTAHI